MRGRAFFTDRRVVVLLALVACLLWGSAYPSVKTGYAWFHITESDTAGKFLFAGYRFLLAGIFLLLFARISGKRIFVLRGSDFGHVALLGLLYTTVQYLLFYIGLGHVTGVTGAIIGGTMTFFSVILAHFLTRSDKLCPTTALGCVVGFAGVVAMNFSPALFTGGITFTGEGFLLTAAFFQALGGIYGKIISQNVDPTLMTGWQLTIGGFVLVGIGLTGGGSLHGFTPASTALLLYMALLSASAFVIMAVLLKYNPVSLITVFNFTIPIFGATLSALLLGERLLEWKNLAGLVCVSFGIWLVTRQKTAPRDKMRTTGKPVSWVQR